MPEYGAHRCVVFIPQVIEECGHTVEGRILLRRCVLGVADKDLITAIAGEIAGGKNVGFDTGSEKCTKQSPGSSVRQQAATRPSYLAGIRTACRPPAECLDY
jgi:hypothetical protein